MTVFRYAPDITGSPSVALSQPAAGEMVNAPLGSVSS